MDYHVQHQSKKPGMSSSSSSDDEGQMEAKNGARRRNLSDAGSMYSGLGHDAYHHAGVRSKRASACCVILWLAYILMLRRYRRGLLIYINSFKCSILSLLLREINGCTLCVILWLLRWNIHQQLQVLHSLITFVGNWRLHIVRHSLITTVAYTTASSASFFDHFCGKLTAA